MIKLQALSLGLKKKKNHQFMENAFFIVPI